MARMFPSNIQQRPQGKLLVEELFPNCVEVFYVPPIESLEAVGLNPDKPEAYKTQLMTISGQDNFVEITPINTLPRSDEFLEQKYTALKSIVLEGFDYITPETEAEAIEFLEELPSAFIKDFDYGLGFQKDYRFIAEVVEGFGASTLVISKKVKKEAEIDVESHRCTIKFSLFDKIRRDINKIGNKTSAYSTNIKRITANNLLAYFLNDEKYPQITFQYKNDSLHNMIASSSSAISLDLSKKEQKEVVELVSKNKKIISEEQPEMLVKLHNDIELVTLEKLIEKYEQSLGKNLKEGYWQKLFSENPFILSMVFGIPIMKINGQAYVGGKKLSGDGEKITDFLVKNPLSNNIGLIEIKTPNTQLLNKTPYRDSVFVSSSDLSGSIGQILDQKYKIQKEISSIKNNSRIYDIETYSIKSVLIVGTMPVEPDKQKSFEMIRGNSKDVFIITFDELLNRLKDLLAFLNPEKNSNNIGD